MKKNIRKLLLLGVLSVFVVSLFLISITRRKIEAENRALVLVISNNYKMPEEMVKNYKENEKLWNLILSFMLKVPQKELKELSFEEIIVHYGEDFFMERYKKAAGNYERIIALTGKDASYENFKDALIALDKEGLTIDILLNLRGSKERILFSGNPSTPDYGRSIVNPYGHSVEKKEILNDFENPLNIGFVYQTSCYGFYDMDFWIEIGAKTVTGAKGKNGFVVFSPETFLKEWGKGKSFEEAVGKAYDYEYRRWRWIDRFAPVYIYDPEESEMIFMGEKDYRLE
jgi:hypothetical protein